MKRRAINVTVETDDPETLTRAIECLARSLSGLALEGIPAYMSVDDPTTLEETEP